MGCVDRLVLHLWQHPDRRDVDHALYARAPCRLEHVACAAGVGPESEVRIAVQRRDLDVARAVHYDLRLDAIEEVDQPVQVLDRANLDGEPAEVIAQPVGNLGRWFRRAGQHCHSAFRVDQVAGDVAADEPQATGDQYRTPCRHQARLPLSTARAVDSSVTRTSSAPARRAPRIAARFSRPAARPIPSGIFWRVSHSIAMSRPSSTCTGSPPASKNRVDVSPTAPASSRRLRSRGEMWWSRIRGAVSSSVPMPTSATSHAAADSRAPRIEPSRSIAALMSGESTSTGACR